MENKIHLSSNPRLSKVTINGQEVAVRSIQITQDLDSYPIVTLEFALIGGMEAECTLVGRDIQISFDNK